ncbi:MAG: MBL fold metallo-hydrolase [Thermoplasmata archaeon]|nr:MBL fold metallo-hydrolase [Thermoplasmata archaeon]MBE3137392.1 MBL fold metallo-hydrolase [Thermoplasmata archaeon]MBE3140354.1 MBL fold metallo-hydrolase [Thermoplasmata archaeon]
MNNIKFLGTAGARFVVMKQLRASGGIWLTLDDTNVMIDPGPGSLVRCISSKPKLNPMDLDGIILTHRHIDHSNDINIMIEAMTNGGFKKKGVVFAPRDTLEGDPVILKYIREHVERIEILKEKGKYHVGNISFETPIQLKHGVETYGVNIRGKTSSISLITDTDYFTGLAAYFTGDILIVNVVMLEDKSTIEHLCLQEAEQIIETNKPRLAILTHFGMGMVKAKPWELAEQLTKKLGVTVIAARDGMQVDIDQNKK